MTRGAPQWKDRLEDNRSRQEVLKEGMTMKIVSINNNPSACEDGGCIRRDVTSLDAIVNNIDTYEGRNAALKAYVYALRDLQVAHNDFVNYGDASRDDIDKAKAAVAKAFDRLVFCEYSLNRFPTYMWGRED